MGRQLSVRFVIAFSESSAASTLSRVPMRASEGMSITMSALAPAAIASWRDREAMSESEESAETSVRRAAIWDAESAAGACCGEGVSRAGDGACEQAARGAGTASGVMTEGGFISQGVWLRQ